MSQTLFFGFPIPVVAAFAALVLVLAALAWVVALLRKPVTVLPPSSSQWRARAQDARGMEEVDRHLTPQASRPGRSCRTALSETAAEAEAQHH